MKNTSSRDLKLVPSGVAFFVLPKTVFKAFPVTDAIISNAVNLKTESIISNLKTE